MRILILLSLCSALSGLPLLAQYEVEMAERHDLIDSLYRGEEYLRTIDLIDMQWEKAADSHWQDSLYSYCYEYARSVGKTAGGEAALKAAEEYVRQCQEFGNTTETMLSLYYDLSYIQYDYGQLLSALHTDSLALQYGLSRSDLPSYRIGKLYANVGFDCHALGRLKKGLEMYSKAVIYLSEPEGAPADNFRAIASAQNGVAALHWQLGDLDAAEKAFEDVAKTLAGHHDEETNSIRVSTLLNRALLFEDRGDIKSCRESYEECIRLCFKSREALDSPQEKEELTYIISKALSNLGALYFATGQLDISGEYLDRAYALRSTVMDEDDMRLHHINGQRATLCIGLGEYDRAEELQTTLLNALIPTYGYNSERTIMAMIDLASTYSYQQDHARADSMLQALVSLKESGLESMNEAMMLRVYMKMAESAGDQSRWEEAVDLIGRGIEMRTEINGSEYFQVLNMRIQKAEYLGEAGRYEEAKKEFEAIIGILDRRSKSQSGLLDTEHNPHMLPLALGKRGQMLMADPHADEAQIREAKAAFDRAMDIIERKSDMLRGQNATLAYFGRLTHIYPQAQSALMELADRRSDPQLAEEILQIGEKNKTILLKSRLSAIERMTFSGIPDSVVAQEQRLLERMAQGIIPEDMEAAAHLTLSRAEEEYKALNALIQREYPRYHSLRNSSGQVSVEEIREEILTADQSLIAYSVVDEGVLAVLVDADTALVHFVELADDRDVFTTLIDHSRRPGSAIADDYASLIHDLLFAPLRPFIKGEELLIVPDEELYQINFEMLLNVEEGEEGRRLIEDYTISYLLSASTALQFGRLDKERGKGALAVAPGFSDELKSDYKRHHPDSATHDLQYLGFVQQPFAVSSAQKLGKLLSADVLVGLSASEDRFKKNAADYDIIHLGTHTKVNDISPLYSKLVLSKTDSSFEDGYLHAFELYDMTLKAELAVLTACETGSGGDEKAEGIRSLAHGFAYAGCPSVIMSLWEIDERSTSEIIDGFYGYLAEGEQKNVALRKAKLEFIKSNPELSDPYYWAGLVLIGDVDPVRMNSSFWSTDTFICLGLAIILMSLIALVWYRRRKR